jgi:hypothetical protein
MLIALGPAGAQARVVAPGGKIDPFSDPLTGVSLAERPELMGQIIADLLVPFSNGEFFQGTVRTQVVREDVSGTLDFYYTVDPHLDEVRISGFGHFLTDVDWRDDLGKGASGGFRTADGDTLDLAFNGGGPTFVKTDATAFARTGVFLAFPNGGDPPPPAVAVFSPIPLPPAVLAAPAAFALAAFAGRRLRRTWMCCGAST